MSNRVQRFGDHWPRYYWSKSLSLSDISDGKLWIISFVEQKITSSQYDWFWLDNIGDGVQLTISPDWSDHLVRNFKDWSDHWSVQNYEISIEGRCFGIMIFCQWEHRFLNGKQSGILAITHLVLSSCDCDCIMQWLHGFARDNMYLQPELETWQAVDM